MPVLQHLLFRLPQRVVVLVSCLRQVRHLGRDWGQRAWPLGPTAPGPAWETPPTAPWTCTTPQPQRCSWQQCSRTEHGCPAGQPSGQAWRCPSPPGCAAPAAEPAAPGFPGRTRRHFRAPAQSHRCLQERGSPPTYLFVHLLEEGNLLLQGLDAPFEVNACQRGCVHVLGGHRVRRVVAWGEHQGWKVQSSYPGSCPGAGARLPGAVRGDGGPTTWGSWVLTALKAARLFSASSFSWISSCSLQEERRS